MPDSYRPPKFWVHASNIHTDESQVYGPFAGPITMTYETLRANEDYGPPFEIFRWIDPQDTGRDNEHGYESWTDQTGATRYDGWRALESRPANPGPGTYSVIVGPFWTDLVIVTDSDPDDAD